jgi:HNH endonuclease
MRPGFLIFLVTAGAMAHVYTDGRITSMTRSLMNGKTFRLIGAAAAGLAVYYLYKSLDGRRKVELMALTNEYLSNAPVGKLASAAHPIFDMTQYNRFSRAGPDAATTTVLPIRHQSHLASPLPLHKEPVLELLQPVFDTGPRIQDVDGMDLGFSKRSLARMNRSGAQTTGKRSVSGAKRKYIAASQDWLCKHCKCVLSTFFEIDHIVRVADGGSNHISNLAALCLTCHRHKTESQR